MEKYRREEEDDDEESRKRESERASKATVLKDATSSHDVK